MSTITEDRPAAAPAGIQTRRSLLQDIADPSKGTRWSEFDRTYRRVVFGMARNAGLQHHDAEDVTQEVFRSLAASLARFEVRSRPGSFRRYLANLVHWRVENRRTALSRNPLPTEPELMEAEIAQPDCGDGDLEGDPDFRAAVTGAMAVLRDGLSPRDIQILDLYYCAHWDAERIAKLLGTSRENIYVIAHRNRERLAREIRRRL